LPYKTVFRCSLTTNILKSLALPREARKARNISYLRPRLGKQFIIDIQLVSSVRPKQIHLAPFAVVRFVTAASESTLMIDDEPVGGDLPTLDGRLLKQAGVRG
jgi:hypothetical protein